MWVVFVNAPLQAFVLKCPECTAPQPGTTSVCAYCKVPLMWAPSRSVGRDDHGLFDVEDEPGTELMVFGPHVILGNDAQHFSMQPQKFIHPRFLWIHPRCSDDVRVSSIRLGITIIGDASVSNSPISGSLFSRGRGWPLDTDAMAPGVLFTFVVHNRTHRPVEVEGALRVMPFKERPVNRSNQAHAVDASGRLRERFPGEWGPVIVGGKIGDKSR